MKILIITHFKFDLRCVFCHYTGKIDKNAFIVKDIKKILIFRKKILNK